MSTSHTWNSSQRNGKLLWVEQIPNVPDRFSNPETRRPLVTRHGDNVPVIIELLQKFQLHFSAQFNGKRLFNWHVFCRKWEKSLENQVKENLNPFSVWPGKNGPFSTSVVGAYLWFSCVVSGDQGLIRKHFVSRVQKTKNAVPYSLQI